MRNLKAREKEFVYFLIEETEYRPISYYAEKLQVSTKTLQLDLKHLRVFLAQYGIEIFAGSGRGIRIDSLARHSSRLLNDMKLLLTDEDDGGSKTRRDLILKEMLLYSNQPISIQHLSEQYYVGKTSIVNDMKYIEKWLQKYDLALERTSKGTLIRGDEVNIRKAIARYAIRENARNGLQELFDKVDINFTEDLLTAVAGAELDISDIYYINLLTHILICIKRVKEHNHISSNNEELPIDAGTLLQYQEAKEITEQLSNYYHITIGSEETYYIYQYLISSGFESGEVKMLKENDESTAFARELTTKLSEQFCIDFTKEEDLMKGLILHIRPMLNRLEYNIQISNPLNSEIVKNYPEMMKYCTAILDELAKKYHFNKISEDEISNIAVYYQTMLEKIAVRKRVLVVCHSGFGTSQLLAAKLQNEFAFIEIKDVVSSRKVKLMDLSGIDLIISTIPIEAEEIPYVVISSLLTERDVKLIRNCLLANTAGCSEPM